jgi:hypothetical protein
MSAAPELFDVPDPPWTLSIRRWPALARTQITLAGRADRDALEALAREVKLARVLGDEVTLDFSELVSLPKALAVP